MHLGDELSALLDGELTADEEVAVRAHLAECAECAAELAAVDEVRSLVRGLPPVDPPLGFLERLTRRRNHWPQAAGAVGGGVAAAVAIVMLVTPRAEPVSPPMADLVQTHAATVSVAGDPVSQLVPAESPDPTAPAP